MNNNNNQKKQKRRKKDGLTWRETNDNRGELKRNKVANLK